MGKPLDLMAFTVTRRAGEWDGSWSQDGPLLTAALDGAPTPKSTATLDDVAEFVPGDYGQFYDTAGEILGLAQIVSIDGGTKIITFATNSLTWDAAVGDRVMPALVINASRPQPVGPETIEMLDEAARTSARFVIYAEDTEPGLYLVGREREGYAADAVAYNGQDYVVTTTDDWNGRPLGYLAYILLEFAPDEKVPE